MQNSVSSTYQAMQDRVQEILINITHNQIITQRITAQRYRKSHHSDGWLTRHTRRKQLKITGSTDKLSWSSCNPCTESNPFVAVSMHVSNACWHHEERTVSLCSKVSSRVSVSLNCGVIHWYTAITSTATTVCCVHNHKWMPCNVNTGHCVEI